MRLLVSRRMHSIDANPLARVLFGAGHFLDSPGRTNGLLCVLQVPVPWMVWVDSMFCLSFRPCSSWHLLETRRAIPFPSRRGMRRIVPLPPPSLFRPFPLRVRFPFALVSLRFPSFVPVRLVRRRTPSPSHPTFPSSPCFLVCFVFLFVSRSYRVLSPASRSPPPPEWVRGCICTPPRRRDPSPPSPSLSHPAKGVRLLPLRVQLVLLGRHPVPRDVATKGRERPFVVVSRSWLGRVQVRQHGWRRNTWTKEGERHDEDAWGGRKETPRAKQKGKETRSRSSTSNAACRRWRRCGVERTNERTKQRVGKRWEEKHRRGTC